MTEITLRAYIREIDNLIEQEKLDEAIAHCRHLLQRHPKYIECYRLLGKAYLEAKRFGDAADIFQRVLSTVPDDFVSHIGMSIVREDEGNLDSAIWHMERAFETNPANPAIQQELKRLIGRRDGFEPHKVRLTRGALARMYAHGELYPQAIAELQSALDESSDRPDLQVLLARLLWQTDQTTEAAEISGELLEKLPFCLQATRITAAVLQQRGKSEEATAYHRRLAQLDPYMAYTEAPMAEPVRVDADTIMVQKLDWQPGQPLPSTEAAPADWAASLGLEDDEGVGPGTGPLPSWLDDVETPQVEGLEEVTESQPIEAALEPEVSIDTLDEEIATPSEDMGAATTDGAPEPQPEVEVEGEDKEIPEWMQEAGWQESSGEAEESAVSFSSEELDQLERGELPAEAPEATGESGDLEPAEIPSWLQGMAPGDDAAQEAAEDDDELEAILRAEAEPTVEPDSTEISDDATETDLPEAEESTQDVASWLDEGEPGATSTIMTWLGDREQEEEEPTEVEQPESVADLEIEDELDAQESTEESEEDEGVPSWLSGVAQAAAESDELEEQELAEFRQRASKSQEETGELEAESLETGDVPAWLMSITGEPEPTDELVDSDVEQLAGETGEDLPWDAEVEAAEQDTIPKDSLPSEEIEDEQALGWLGGFEGEAEETILQQSDEDFIEEDAEPEEDWLAGLGEAETEGAEEFAEEASWLEELSGDSEDQFRAETSEPTPGWMDGLAEEEDETIDDEVEARASSWLDDLSDTLAETPAEPGELAGDEGLDWLGGMEEEEPSSEVPVEDFDTDLAAEPTMTEQPPPAAELDEIDEEGVFDWLDQMAAQQDQEGPDQQTQIEDPAESEPRLSSEAPPDSYDEGLDWLDRLSETRGIDADIDREPAAGTISGQFAEEGIPETQQQLEADEEPTHLGDWEPASVDRGVEAPAEEITGADEPSASTDDEIPDWLMAQAEQEETSAIAETGGPEAEAPEETPEWLQAAAESEPAPGGGQTPAEDTEEVPDWLQQPMEPAGGEPESTPEPSEPPETVPPPTPVEPETEQPQAAQVEEVPQTPTAQDEEVPDWLRGEVESTEADLSEESMAVAPAEVSEPREAEIEPVEPAPPPSEPVAPPIPEEPEAAPAAEVEAAPQADTAVEEAATTEVEEESIQPPVVEEIQASPEAPAADEFAVIRQSLAGGDEQGAAEALQSLIKERGKLPGVVEILEDHLAEDPDAPILWQILGDAYMRLDKTDKAVKAYDRGMEESEVFDSARQALAGADYERAAAQYGMLIKNKKRLGIVIEDLEKAVKGEGADPRIWQILGDAYMKADRIDESIEAYRKGMDSV